MDHETDAVARSMAEMLPMPGLPNNISRGGVNGLTADPGADAIDRRGLRL
jgi:hypothetical protein